MKEEILISVAMTTYNGDRYLREQLDSLYNQTRVPDEIVVVDDNSKDKTQEILEEYHREKGLKCIFNKEGVGVNRNFYKAICACKGKYVAICDQDDVWMPNKVEILLKKIQEIECGKPACVSSQIVNVDENLNILTSTKKMDNDSYSLKSNVYGIGLCQGCTMIVNRLLVESFVDFPVAHFLYDAYIGLLATCIGNKYNLAEPLMYYRRHRNNVIGKIEHKSFVKRSILHLQQWKYGIVVPYTRYRTLQFIYDHHKKLINPLAMELIDSLFLYKNSHLFGKLIFILSDDYWSYLERIKKCLMLSISYYLPLPKPNVEF